MRIIYCFFFVIFLVSCEQGPSWKIKEIVNPSNDSSGESSLLVGQDGQVYLSWIDLEQDTLSKLQYATLTDGKFGKPHTIAQGANWFVNWADFPALVQFPNSNNLLAHWLQKSDNGTYDYDVRISSTDNRSGSWSPSKILHNDGIAAEHGFVSITPYEEDLLAVWLDGRKMKKSETEDKESSGHDHGVGAMTLRAAVIDKENNISNRIELDDQVCECCQTDVAITDQGPIVVYRNNEKGIRDIYYTRGIGDDWTIPKAIYEDGWQIAGCPVNGPRIDALGSSVAITWYSGADQKVKTVYSIDSGANFSEPLVVNDMETLGRLDICFISSSEYVISYMESQDDLADVVVKQYNIDDGTSVAHHIGKTSAARASGFPRLAASEDHLYVSYTYVDSTFQKVVVKGVNI